MTHLDPRILDAWAATAHLHAPDPGATPDAIDAAERAIGRRLPSALRELYLAHDGGGFVEGNLGLSPILESNDRMSIVGAGDMLRTWEWPVPDEVVIFGGDGCGDHFGLWLPGTDERELVVTVGAVFEPGCMGIVGQDLNGFLLSRTAYYLLPATDRTAAGLNIIDVPQEYHELGDQDLTDDVYTRLFAWANPLISPALLDAYAARLTAEDVHRIACSV